MHHVQNEISQPDEIEDLSAQTFYKSIYIEFKVKVTRINLLDRYNVM